jgi:hypothetical protein
VSGHDFSVLPDASASSKGCEVVPKRIQKNLLPYAVEPALSEQRESNGPPRSAASDKSITAARRHFHHKTTTYHAKLALIFFS